MTMKEELEKAGFTVEVILPKEYNRFSDFRALDKDQFIRVCAKLNKDKMVFSEDRMDYFRAMIGMIDRQLYWFSYGGIIFGVEVDNE